MDSEFIDDTTTVDFDVTFEHVMNTCKIKERIDQEDIETVFDNTLPTTQTEKCFVACWLEQFHVVSRVKRNTRCVASNGVVHKHIDGKWKISPRAVHQIDQLSARRRYAEGKCASRYFQRLQNNRSLQTGQVNYISIIIYV